MDALSQILHALKTRHTAVGTLTLGAPWGLRIDDFTAPTVYGLAAGAPCWLQLAGREAIELMPGDVALLSGVERYELLSAPGIAAEPLGPAWAANGLPAFQAQSEPGAPLHFTWGGSGAGTTLLGLAFGLPGGPRNPLLMALPPLIVWRRAQGGAFPWMRPAIDFLLAKEAQSPGFTATARLMAELVFVSLVRSHLLQAPADTQGWLRGLTDPCIARALQALHADPATDWTVATLAQVAGLSRTVFSTRFSELVGASPIEYLTRWRMHLAADRLSRERPNLTQLAFELGYTSDAAFRSAFKRYHGVPPSRYGLAAEAGGEAAGDDDDT